MQRIALTTCVAALIAGAAVAADYDADGDGQVTFDEILALVPTMTEETFSTVDTDGDGMLNADELAAAQESGLIPAAG